MSTPLNPEGDLTTNDVVDTDGDGRPDTVQMTDEAGNKIDGTVQDDGTVTFTQNGEPAGEVTAEQQQAAAGGAAVPLPADVPADAAPADAAPADAAPADQPQDDSQGELTPEDQEVPQDPDITSNAPYDANQDTGATGDDSTGDDATASHEAAADAPAPTDAPTDAPAPTDASAPTEAPADPAAQPDDSGDSLTAADQQVPENPDITSGTPYDAGQGATGSDAPADPASPAAPAAPATGEPAAAAAPDGPQHTPDTPATPGAPDGDGIQVTSALDTDGDGNPDVVHAIDTESGDHLTAHLDAQGNVTLVEDDVDHDGNPDMIAYGGPNGSTIVEADVDHNGSPDLAAKVGADGQLEEVHTLDAAGNVTSATLDTNGDGSPDVTLADTDGDGKPDVQVLDQDHDQIPDTVIHMDAGGAAISTEYVYGGPDGADADPVAPGEELPTMPLTEEFHEANHGADHDVADPHGDM
ncbi:hypothetical protein ACPXCG_12940 [Gordonia sp. DT218]|uniref:hypothetical protein n=1 Tax=Gordonia sp. DT218 TaxID=3416659 RepID=UPI003CF10535